MQDLQMDEGYLMSEVVRLEETVLLQVKEANILLENNKN